MGYQFQFVTLAGFQGLNYSTAKPSKMKAISPPCKGEPLGIKRRVEAGF